MNRRIWQRVSVWIVLSLIAAAMVAVGCEDTPRDKLSDGKQALADGELQRAEQFFEAALEADDRLVEARRLMATTHLKAGRFEAAERTLVQLWDDQSFDREGDLTADQRQTRQLMSEQFSELYRSWADSIDTDEEPEKFEQIARRGLERNSRDSRLNTMLVDFYEERADRFVERGKKVRAAEMLERIDDLHRFPDTRRESRRRARRLRREAFGQEAIERFETELQPELSENGAYDPQQEVVSMTIEQPLDRRLDPEDGDAVERARTTAVQTLSPTLSQFALSMSGLDTDEVDPAAVSLPELKIDEEDFRAGYYEMTVSLELEALVDMAFEYSEYVRTGADDERRQDGDGDQIAAEDQIELDTSALETE